MDERALRQLPGKRKRLRRLPLPGIYADPGPGSCRPRMRQVGASRPYRICGAGGTGARAYDHNRKAPDLSGSKVVNGVVKGIERPQLQSRAKNRPPQLLVQRKSGFLIALSSIEIQRHKFMALIILARHGQASFGTSNYDRLSELGKMQATWLGEYFKERSLTFHSVHCGTLNRQRDTARAILQAMGSSQPEVAEDSGFNEYHAEPVFRAYAGDIDPIAMQNADYKHYWRTFRLAMAAWAADELSNLPESWDKFGKRMMTALEKSVRGSTRDDVILIVSSGGAIARGLADILDMPAHSAIELNLQFKNSAFCELIASSAGLRLINMNSYPHLDRADRRDAITAA